MLTAWLSHTEKCRERRQSERPLDPVRQDISRTPCPEWLNSACPFSEQRCNRLILILALLEGLVGPPPLPVHERITRCLNAHLCCISNYH